MKRNPIIRRIIRNLLGKGFEQVRKNARETVLRSRKAKLTFVVQNTGTVLSMRNRKETVLMHN